MFGDILCEILTNVSAKQVKTTFKRLEKHKRKKTASNVTVFRKLLQILKIQNEMIAFLFGFSNAEYQNKILSLAFDLCDWYIKQTKQTNYPLVSIDKTVTNILSEFNRIQIEEQNKWSFIHFPSAKANDDEQQETEIKSKTKTTKTKTKTKEEMLKEIEEELE